MRKIEFAHEILSESRRSTQIYLESGRDYDKVKANMYSVFECYAHGLISWNQVRSRWHSSILEYLNLYADRPDLYLSESNRMLGEYETTLQTHKPALDEYKRVNEQKMTSNIVVKGKLNESQAKEQSNVYFNRRTLKESELKDTTTMKTWKRVQESYPNLTSKDEMRIRMLTIFEGSTVDTTKLVTTYMSEEPTAISGPMQTSMRPKPRPVATANNNLADVYPPRGDMEMDPANLAKRSSLAPTTSPRPMPRPAATQSIGAGSQVAYMDNGAVDGSTRGIDPADAYSPEDLARLTGQPAPSLAPTTSPRPMPRPATLKQSANNNIRKEAAAIFNRIKVAATEGYKVLPPMDKERYGEIPGLEGPFTTLSGKVVYYDPKEGAYYDRDTDMYLSNDEYTALNSDYSGMQDERDIKVREADMPLARPNYMDTKNNPEILSAFEKQRQNWLKTGPWPVDVERLNDLVNFGNKIPNPLKGIDTRPVKSTLTKGSMNYFKDKPGIGQERVDALNAFIALNKENVKEADLDEKAKWRSSSAAKKITDPDKDLGMADYDYHHENPRSTGRLQSIADTEPSDGSINNRQKSKINSKGDRKGKISRADINRVKSNAFNTLNKEETELDEAKAKPGHNARVMANNLNKVFKAKPDFLDMDKDGDKEEPMKKAAADSKKKVSEAPLLGPQGKIHRAASADQSDREYASQRSFKDAWTAKNVGKKWPGYSEAGYKRPTYKKEESALDEAGRHLDYVPRKSSNTEIDVKGTKVPIKKHSWGDWEVPYGPYKDIGQHKSKESLVNALHTRIKEEVDENAWNQLGQKKPVGDILPAPAKGSVPNHGKKFKEGDIVIPHAGPHAGVKHKVVFSRVGSVNMIPLGLSAKEDKYNSATVRAKHEHLSPYTKPVDEAKYQKVGNAKVTKESVAESYTGRETKDGTWRVFKTGDAVAVAGPFKSKEEASAWIKKQSSVTEAVTLDYSRYMRAHGKKPRDAGMGSSTWMFTTAEFGNPSEDEIFQFQGSFADAKKAAAKWAKSQSEYRFYVME